MSGPDLLFSQKHETLWCDHTKIAAKVGIEYNRQATKNILMSFPFHFT